MCVCVCVCIVQNFKEFEILCYVITTRKTKSIFSHIYRMHANSLTVRAGSAHHEFGGTIHSVQGGFYHGNYNEDNHDNDVAVLRVCTDFDIAINISNYVMCLQ